MGRKEREFGVYEDDLVSLVFDKINQDEFKICRKDLKMVFEMFTDEIIECLKQGNKVQIKDFLTIKTYTPKLSQSKHPITGKMIIKGKNRRIKVVPIGKMKKFLRR